ncbi:MAG: DUF1963 domain-containing protein [Candidatus Eremiobacteraeota bacterium]|nr:DUF1963 domain-containing protein [Candidatus Eremiobacteraeota bacterium]MCW5871920.1 DUF1963 domain-containing protein [Candidatus Eremiobacteraeota bacterium]
MSAFLQRAFANWDCIYICQMKDFWPRMQAVLTFQNPDEYTITIGEWLLEARPGPQLPAGESSVRAALRQDPDCLLVAQAEGDQGPLLLQAALTGHRVVAGFALTPRQVLQKLLEEQEGLGFTQARSLFFEPDGLWIYSPEKDIFERVSAFEEGTFRDLILPAEPPPPPPPPAPEPLQAPAEWGPASPLLPELEAIFTPLARPCYAPLFNDGPRAGQFGGRPRLAPSEEWPRCGACQERLHLVCELDLAQLPESRPFPASGWLQLFYCTSDHCDHPQAWGPFSHNALARRLPEGEPALLAPPNSAHPQRNITGWQALLDYPGWEERPPLNDRQRTASYNLEEPAFLEHFGLTQPANRERAAAYFRNYPGDKLLGWPAWTQSADYPRCPQCARPMSMFFQINNDGQDSQEPGYTSCHGQIFAADGNGHIFVCAIHPDQLTFSWACG